MTEQFRTLCCALTVALLAGCGGGSDGPTEYAVTGTVTFDGEPLAEGSLLFIDPAGKSRSYPGVIKEGVFSSEMTAGKKTVQITAIRPDPGKTVPSGDGLSQEPAFEQYIPAKYNKKSTLEIEVTDSGDNKFEFDLTSK